MLFKKCKLCGSRKGLKSIIRFGIKIIACNKCRGKMHAA